jgi:hypothetical protein
MNNSLLISSLFAAAGFLSIINGETVNLTGVVRDSASRAGIAGATVGLKGLPLSTVTNASGAYSLSGSSTGHFARNSRRMTGAFVKNDILFFRVENNREQVRLDLYDLSGRHLGRFIDTPLDRGSYRYGPFAAVLSSRLYAARLQTGTAETMVKLPCVHPASAGTAPGLRRTAGSRDETNGLEKTSAAIDTLVVSAAGYEPGRTPISSYIGVNGFSLVATGGIRATIAFENGSYQSCLVPLVITVIDSGLTSATVPVRVKSSSDTIGITAVLKKVPGAVGTYADSVFFSIVKSDSSRRLIRVRDGDTVTATYADDSPEGPCSERTVWTGLPGNVQPKGSPIIGVIHGLGITLWDSDITDSAVTISVWSKRDTAGLRVSLKKVAQSSGDYIGKIGLSLRRSRGDSVLAVGPGSDTIFMRYHDLTPKADIMGTGCIWLSMPANMFLDSALYHGTASVMTINLTDDDIEDSTVVVTIKSATDPAGIIDTLKAFGGMNRYFIGGVGFTTGASRPGFISVADGDSVKVSYRDDSPVQTVIQSAVWSTK